jgi:hypothetical protein
LRFYPADKPFYLLIQFIETCGKAFAYLIKTIDMKTFPYLWLCLFALAVTFSSCEVIGGIFKAGFWTAIIIVVVVIALILWLVGRGRR